MNKDCHWQRARHVGVTTSSIAWAVARLEEEERASGRAIMQFGTQRPQGCHSLSELSYYPGLVT
jgi:hypothetical protein